MKYKALAEDCDLHIDATWNYSRCQKERCRVMGFRVYLEQEMGEIGRQLRGSGYDAEWRRRAEGARAHKRIKLELVMTAQRELTRRMKLLKGEVEHIEFCYQLVDLVSARLGEEEADKLIEEANEKTAAALTKAISYVPAALLPESSTDAP